jgi:hypothetical protein
MIITTTTVNPVTGTTIITITLLHLLFTTTITITIDIGDCMIK